MNIGQFTLFLLLLFTLGCGTAAEFDEGPVSAPRQDAENDPDSTYFGSYWALAGPETGLQLVPINAASELAGRLFLPVPKFDYLATQYGSNIVQPSSGTTVSEFDDGSNALRIIEGTGLCLTTVSGFGNEIQNLQLEMRYPSVSTLTYNGAVSSCGSSSCVSYQNIYSGETVCRGWDIFNSSGASYTFQIYFTGTTATGDDADIKTVNPVNLSYSGAGQLMQVSGEGFGSSPTLTINGNTIATDSASDTLITATINSAITMDNGVGLVTVTNNDSGEDIVGPYAVQPQALDLGVRLPLGAGTVTSKLIIRLENTAVCPAVVITGCPFTSPDDAVSFPNITLNDSTPVTLRINHVAFTGNACIYIGFDYNQSGALNTGDRYLMFGGSSFVAGQALNVGNRILSSTIGGSGDCP